MPRLAAVTQSDYPRLQHFRMPLAGRDQRVARLAAKRVSLVGLHLVRCAPGTSEGRPRHGHAYQGQQAVQHTAERDMTFRRRSACNSAGVVMAGGPVAGPGSAELVSGPGQAELTLIAA